MKFFAQLEDKIVEVQVARPPKNPDLLMNFKKTNGCTYTGSSINFLGLKKGTKHGTYIAVGIKAEFRTEPIVEEIMIVQNETIVNNITVEPEKEDKIEAIVVQRSAPIMLTVVEESEINDTDFRKFSFDFDFDRVNPESRSEAWITYVKDKNVWISQFGSEQLKLAHEMGCKCDNKYIVERTSKEFPTFQIYEQYPIQEMDTPDTSFLLFLRNEAFTVKQKQIIKKFNGRICLGWSLDIDAEKCDTAETEIIIQGFLGMCDLVCRFEDLLLYVQQSDSRVQDFSYRISG